MHKNSQPLVLSLALLLTFAAAFILGCARGGGLPDPSGVPVRPEQLSIPVLEFHPPKAERFEGPNGMDAYLLTDRELPLVQITAWIRVGRIHEPADKIGLARLTGDVMRDGGARSLPFEQMDDELEFLAASVESGIDEEFGKVSMACLKKDLPRVFEIFSLVLREPAFAPEKFDLARNQLLEMLRRRNDDPPEILRREFRYLLFGKDSPWARTPRSAQVQALTRDDLIDFHRRYVTPDRILLAASGDLSRAELEELMAERFGDWKSAGEPLPDVAPLGPAPEASVNVITLDKTQSQIRIGHRGPRRGDPDEAAFEVVNEVFGMGMASRLYRDVRSARGLAYSVFGFLVPGRDQGFFIASASTKTESAGECLAAMRAQIQGLFDRPISAGELAEAREAIVRRAVFDNDSASKIVNRRAELELMGYPPDYMDTYVARVRAVTTEDLRRVIAKHIDPARLVTLVVGAAAQTDPPLSDFGTVHEIALDKE